MVGGALEADYLDREEPKMVEIVVKPLRKSASGAKPSTVTTKRVRTASGALKTFYTIDAGSQTFSDDLGYAFRQNVKKARKENKRLFGSPDSAPKQD